MEIDSVALEQAVQYGPIKEPNRPLVFINKYISYLKKWEVESPVVFALDASSVTRED